MLAAVAIWIVLFDDSKGNAYALEQTIEAAKNMRWFHFQYRPKSVERRGREAWVEYDKQGKLKHVRVNFYGQNDVMVWKDGVTQLWDKDSNDLSIYEDLEYSDKILLFTGRFDPKSAVEYLSKRAEQGGLHINIVEPGGLDEPVEVTVNYDPNTYVVGAPMPCMRDVFHVNSRTKLIRDVEVHMYREGAKAFEHLGTWEYLDYNQPFAAEKFDLLKEIPADVARFDTRGIEMGLKQGKLSDKEIAVKVVEEFLRAWKDKEYDLAARIKGYDKAQKRDSTLQMFNEMKLLNVLYVAVPSAAKRPMQGFEMQCKLEVERASGIIEIIPCRIIVVRRTTTSWCIGAIDFSK